MSTTLLELFGKTDAIRLCLILVPVDRTEDDKLISTTLLEFTMVAEEDMLVLVGTVEEDGLISTTVLELLVMR